MTAAVRVSERRARLLGLDEPLLTKSELTGSLSVSAERLAAERELFAKLDVKQLEALAADSQALVDRATAMVQANSAKAALAITERAGVTPIASTDPPTPTNTSGNDTQFANLDRPAPGVRVEATAGPVRVAPSRVAGVGDATTDGPVGPAPGVSDQKNAARPETAP